MPKFLLATILSLAVASTALAQTVTPSSQPESPVSNSAKASGTTIKGTSGKTVRVPPGNMPATPQQGARQRDRGQCSHNTANWPASNRHYRLGYADRGAGRHNTEPSR